MELFIVLCNYFVLYKKVRVEYIVLEFIKDQNSENDEDKNWWSPERKEAF